MLAGADAAGLKTAHGGLLRLLQNLGGWLAGLLGAPDWWSTSLLPFTSGATVQFGFHVFVGLLMAVVYAFLALSQHLCHQPPFRVRRGL